MKFHQAFAILGLFGGAVPAPVSGAGYEIWASDQSNSAAGQTSLGVKGGFIWIYDDSEVENYLQNGVEAVPLPCSPEQTTGPCNTLDVFPQDLVQYDGDDQATGFTLGDLDGFGRLHGVIKDPQERYVNANFFAPGGAYIGIIDTQTKEAIGLFRVTKYNYANGVSNRGVHMSFWTADGDAIVVGNLQGKAIERINVKREDPNDPDKITGLFFDRSASLGLGRGMSVAEEATFFMGKNAHSNDLLGGIVGDYTNADLGDLTPNNYCKENGCANDNPNAGTMSYGGRPNNLPICPVPGPLGNVYITLAAGGLFVADPSTTPMSIVGEYEQNIFYGAGCAGIPANDKVFLTAGVSASGAGKDQSMFAVFAFEDAAFTTGNANAPNDPLPDYVFSDVGNTLSNGNPIGDKESDLTGQLPGITTRRDSHGAAATLDGDWVHIVDRIQNVVEVFHSDSYKRFTYDLTSFSGKSGLNGAPGPCAAVSVNDDAELLLNDPAPDLVEITPDGKYLMIAFRGPAPVSVSHGAQGSCPGVGIVEWQGNNKRGKLVGVIRTTNEIPDMVTIGQASFAGGHPYSGKERSDVHGTIVVFK